MRDTLLRMAFQTMLRQAERISELEQELAKLNKTGRVAA